MNKLLGPFLLALAFLAPINTGQATLVTLPSPIFWPGVGAATNNPARGTGASLTSAGHYYAAVFVAREDMVISHVGFYTRTASGSPTITVGIEALDASGLPSGSAGFGSTNATTGTITTNSHTLQALGASATIPKGSAFAVKMALATGTQADIAVMATYLSPTSSSTPYQVVNTGSPTKGAFSSTTPMIALGSSATTFYQVPATAPYTGDSTNNAFSNSVAGAKRGMRFTATMNARVTGVRWFNSNASGNYNICFLDDSGNELNNSCTAVDGDNNSTNNVFINNYFDNSVSITAGTTYRVVVEPTSTTNVNVTTFTLPTADYATAWPGSTSAYYTTFTTAGGWVESTTLVPLMDVILDQVDNGSGTGGGGNHIIGAL